MESANRLRKKTYTPGKGMTLDVMLKRIQEDDTEAIAQFIMSYQSDVRSVSMDVLQNERTATMATRATFKSAILQLQNGVRTGQIEPWLLWIARNEALALTQIPSRNAAATKPVPKQAGTYVSVQNGVTSENVRQPLSWKAYAAQAKAEWAPKEREQAKYSPGNKTGRFPANTLIIILIALVGLALVWIVMGMLSGNAIVSLPDWGYSWFNSHVFPLF